MTRLTLFVVLLAVFSMLILGCSAPDPVTSPVEPERVTETDSHQLWGYYRFLIDPAGPSIEVVPVRQIDLHKNVKQFVLPPACMDCIKIQPTGPYNNNILPVDVTLKNPTALTGFDIRGILITNDSDIRLENPDSWTGLYDDGGLITINPFKAYAKVVANRAFGPELSFTEHYDVYLSNFGKVNQIDYAIDASFPGRAKEPYEISGFNVSGDIDDLGNNTVTLSVDVFAAADNVNEVVMNAGALGFSSELNFINTSGDTWEYDFTNDFNVAPGDYECEIRASTSSSGLSLYSIVTLTVVEFVVSFSNDIQPIYNTYCTSCHSSVGPPLGLDLTPGNSYAKTVGVAAQQTTMNLIEPSAFALSYLWAKVRGVQDGFPFVGSGARMPMNGPPWVSPDEEALLVAWIDAGALDN